VRELTENKVEMSEIEELAGVCGGKVCGCDGAAREIAVEESREGVNTAAMNKAGSWKGGVVEVDKQAALLIPCVTVNLVIKEANCLSL
jgi:hypothetical protein